MLYRRTFSMVSSSLVLTCLLLSTEFVSRSSSVDRIFLFRVSAEFNNVFRTFSVFYFFFFFEWIFISSCLSFWDLKKIIELTLTYNCFGCLYIVLDGWSFCVWHIKIKPAARVRSILLCNLYTKLNNSISTRLNFDLNTSTFSKQLFAK